MHIAIEGIDGVGKTTVAGKLAETLEFELVEKPLHFLFDEGDSTENYIRIRDEVNKNDNKCFTGWFYGLGNIYLYEKYKGKNIITDRHILSNYSWSGSKESEFVFDAICEAIGFPDYTFVIYASPEVVRSRLMERDANDSDLIKVDFIPEAYEKMMHLMEKHKMPGILIDTSEKTQDEVLCAIMDKLRDEGLIDV